MCVCVRRYSRAKEARDFHHNFLCFGWANLGLPLDWLALIPGALHEGHDSLTNVSKHLHGPLRKQLREMISKQGLKLPNGDRVIIDTHIRDGSALRGGTAHNPGKNWSKVTPYSSREKDFLLRQRSTEDKRLIGVAAITHTKSFYDKLKKLYDQVKAKGVSHYYFL